MSPPAPVQVARYAPDFRNRIVQILVDTGWERRYIDGQLGAIEKFVYAERESRVFIAFLDDKLAGYASVESYDWNRLGQIHGLVVDPTMRRRGVAGALVEACEGFVRDQGGRGIYVDTPVTNSGARDFYLHQGFRQDYVMTAYCDTNLDGVTYLKLFIAS